MKIWKWLLGAVIICIGGLLIYSLFNQEPGPVSDKSVTEQTDQQSEFLSQKKASLQLIWSKGL